MPITYGSICSGIEAATTAWHPLGMCATWYSEIDPFPSAILAQHYPNTPNLGDMTKLSVELLRGKITAPEVLVGGTPCQAFSVAGMREGLTDAADSPSNTWSLQMQLTMFEPIEAIPHQSSSGKMFPASCPIKATPSDAFLVRLLGKTASCSLQGSAGKTLVVCMAPKEQSHGGFWTPNISAWPNDAAVCSLSQVLETGSIPLKYFLSEKACAGILRRAEARGRMLPAALHSALLYSADAGTFSAKNSARSAA